MSNRADIRVVALAAVLAASGRVEAAPWADWVGDYRGALAWSRCTTPGARTATLSLDAVDGVLQLDLAPAGRALRTFVLAEDDDGALAARDGDLAVTIRRPRARTIALVVAYDSGCTLRATLVRAATRCDRLAGWTRIAARCTKREVDIPARCGDADRLELALIDAGCAPHPEGDLATRSAACSALASATAALERCAVPPPVRAALATRARAIIGASRTAVRATLPVVEAECRAAHAGVTAALATYRCP